MPEPGRQGVRVVATGGEWPAGLALVRGLRRGGYEPIVAVTSPDALAAHSRASARMVVVPEPDDARAHAAGVARAAVEHDAQVVLPGSDASLVALAEHADEFDSGIRLGVPAREAVRTATDKRALEALAQRAGLRTPETQVVRSASEFKGRFPAIVKPQSSVVVHEPGRQEHVAVALVRDADQLAAALARLRGGEAVVQPYLTARLRTVNGVAWEGRLVSVVHKRGDRTWPTDAGVFAYGRTIPADPDLEARCARLLGEIGWSGLFNLQFLETATGENLLIDLNPRAYHSLALATGAGANLAATWCDLLLARSPRVAAARVGVVFRSEEEDLRALWGALRARRFRDAAAVLRPRRRTVHALFEPGDPGPLLHSLRSLLR